MEEIGRAAARAADARRAHQPGRHERAQHPLLHDPRPGPAADPARPLRLLLARPRRPARARPGAPGHGFTLSAIEKYVARIPEDATPEDIALHRTLLAPWMAEMPDEMTRAELDERAGRKLADDDLETLEALGMVCRSAASATRWRSPSSRSGWAARPGLPDRGGHRRRRGLRRARPAIAEEINEVFRTRSGRPTRRRACPPSAAGPRRAAQAAVDRRPGPGVRVSHERDQARGDRPPHAVIPRPATRSGGRGRPPARCAGCRPSTSRAWAPAR